MMMDLSAFSSSALAMTTLSRSLRILPASVRNARAMEMIAHAVIHMEDPLGQKADADLHSVVIDTVSAVYKHLAAVNESASSAEVEALFAFLSETLDETFMGLMNKNPKILEAMARITTHTPDQLRELIERERDATKPAAD